MYKARTTKEPPDNSQCGPLNELTPRRIEIMMQNQAVESEVPEAE
jgi:hypothetical protein